MLKAHGSMQSAGPLSACSVPSASRYRFQAPIKHPITCLLEWEVSLFFMVSNPVSLWRRLIWSATRSFMMEFKASCSSVGHRNFNSEQLVWASTVTLLCLFSAGSQKDNSFIRDLCKHTVISFSHTKKQTTKDPEVVNRPILSRLSNVTRWSDVVRIRSNHRIKHPKGPGSVKMPSEQTVPRGQLCYIITGHLGKAVWCASAKENPVRISSLQLCIPLPSNSCLPLWLTTASRKKMKIWTNRISQFNSALISSKWFCPSPEEADGPKFKVSYETPRSTEQIQTAHHQERCLLPERDAASSIQGPCKCKKIKNMHRDISGCTTAWKSTLDAKDSWRNQCKEFFHCKMHRSCGGCQHRGLLTEGAGSGRSLSLLGRAAWGDFELMKHPSLLLQAGLLHGWLGF